MTKAYLLSTVSSLALAGVAAAADLPVKAPPVAVVVDYWTGPYVGVNAGVAWHRWRFNDVDDQLFLVPGVGRNANNVIWSSSQVSFTAGGQAGFNVQSGRLVYGIEADLNWVSGSSSITIPLAVGVNNTATAATRLDWIGTIRGRLGMTLSPTMIYVTGGAAFAHVRDTLTATFPAHVPAINDRVLFGYAVGGGVEHRLSPDWTVKAEALYVGLQRSTVSTFFSGNTYRTEFRHSAVLARIGINRRFGAGN